MLFYSPEKRDAALARMADVDENRQVNQAIGRDLQRFDLIRSCLNIASQP